MDKCFTIKALQHLIMHNSIVYEKKTFIVKHLQDVSDVNDQPSSRRDQNEPVNENSVVIRVEGL